jgi:CheY-like chemotaxis protein
VISVVDNEKQVMARGAEGFLIKPVDRFSLLNKLSRLVKQGRQQKLLLIDDDKTWRYVLNQLLVHIPLDILEAADGREGIRLAQVENPDCIVLDFNMPELSGIEVLNQLKSNSATSTIPVIVNTSKQLEPEEQKFLAQHTVAILSKESLSQEVALAQLREALRKAGLFLDT